MLCEINKELKSFKENIKKIEESDLSDIQNVAKGIQVSRECLHRLRLILRDQEFNSKQGNE